MSLPIITTPEYTIQLHSIKTPVRYRPYLVKEEKIFLTAKESNDPQEIRNAVTQILTACTNGKVDIGSLPSFDLEFLFLNLRAKSVNNIIEVRYRCESNANIESPTPCHHINAVRINVDDVKIEVPEGHSPIIKITDDITLELQYPTMDSVEPGGDVAERVAPLIASCLKTIVGKDGVAHEARDYTTEQLEEFVGSMPIGAVKKCEAFFQTMPKVRIVTQFTCAKCHYSEPITFEGLGDFFD